jgi:hypothetical protein
MGAWRLGSREAGKRGVQFHFNPVGMKDSSPGRESWVKRGGVIVKCRRDDRRLFDSK